LLVEDLLLLRSIEVADRLFVADRLKFEIVALIECCA
jgi:hypothetical protein